MAAGGSAGEKRRSTQTVLVCLHPRAVESVAVTCARVGWVVCRGTGRCSTASGEPGPGVAVDGLRLSGLICTESADPLRTPSSVSQLLRAAPLLDLRGVVSAEPVER
jgi:hypothetical protein